MKVIITGATSGLGLAVARQLLKPGDHGILPVRHSSRANVLSDLEQINSSLSFPVMDLSSLDSVRSGVDTILTGCDMASVDAVFFNAGVQSNGGLDFCRPGWETTFVTNHLSHHLLYRALQPLLKPQATLVWTSSGTINPAAKEATRFGFRGAQYRNFQQVLRGDYGNLKSSQDSLDAYATSKFCNLLSVRTLARQDRNRRYLAFDPGLMAGTSLARNYHPVLQFVWNWVLPVITRLVPTPGASTPQKSAQVIGRVLSADGGHFESGGYMNHTGKVVPPWLPENADALGEELITESDRLIAPWIDMPRNLSGAS